MMVAARQIAANDVVPLAFGLMKLPHVAKKIYNGMTRDAISTAVSVNSLRIGIFGDSVGGFKPQWINDRLSQALGGKLGGFCATVNYTGGAAANPLGVADCSYWINGGWHTLPTGGTIEFMDAGARMLATTLKIYYVKETGAGTFKVQINSGAGYADEAGYTSVDANNSSTTAGIITLTKASPLTSSIKLVGLTGTVHVIGCAYIYETQAGTAVFNMAIGGLDIVNSIVTPRAIRSVVFNDLQLDLASMEWKGEATFTASFNTFMSDYLADVTTPTDWYMIGTSPAQDSSQESGGLIVNATLRAWADANGKVYFDGYTPLVSWTFLNGLGWGGDGLHLAPPAHAYIASMLWSYLGFDTLSFVSSGRDWRGNGVLPPNSTIEVRGSPQNTYPVVGRLKSDNNSLDLFIQGGRTVTIQDVNGNNKASFNTGGGFPNFLFGTVLGFSAPFTTNGPALRTMGSLDASGLYVSGLAPGDGSTYGPFMASEFRLGDASATGLRWTKGTGSPEGVVSAAIGSLYSRKDGGASTSLYVKESGTGNTGWVAK